jgi:hypothetical protein
MYRCLALITLTASFASIINVEIGRLHLARFAVDFVLNSTDQVIPGHLLLNLESSRLPQEEAPAVESETENRIIAARVANGTVTLEYRIDLRNIGMDLQALIGVNSGYLSAGPMSSFARQFGSFLFNPISDGRGQIVLTPSDPTEYAYEGRIFYGTNLDPNAWTVNTSVGIIGQESTYSTNLRCRINSHSGRFHLPLSIVDAVYERLQELGIDVYMGDGHIVYRSIVTPAQIETFPILQFILNDQDGNGINVAQVYPRDYMRGRARYTCDLLVVGDDDECALHSGVFRKVVMHFDPFNNRVGFADPIHEI